MLQIIIQDHVGEHFVFNNNNLIKVKKNGIITTRVAMNYENKNT